MHPSNYIPHGVLPGRWINRDHIAISLGGENIDRWVLVDEFAYKHPKITFILCVDEAQGYVTPVYGQKLQIVYNDDLMFDGKIQRIDLAKLGWKVRARLYAQDFRR